MRRFQQECCAGFLLLDLLLAFVFFSTFLAIGLPHILHYARQYEVYRHQVVQIWAKRNNVYRTWIREQEGSSSVGVTKPINVPKVSVASQRARTAVYGAPEHS